MEMREILFRGKRIDDGEWVDGYLLKYSPIFEELSYILPLHQVCVSEVEVIPETVCQYTGLTDKNGRKIFEGDIVRYHFGKDVAPIKFGLYQNCFDSQRAEHCGFYVDWKSERNFRKDLGYWVHMVDAEIIGNIFDGGREDD